MARKKKTVAKKNTTTKASASWTRCATPKCRRKAKEGSTLCAECYGASFPSEAVQRLTEVEALQFSSMDAEIRNHAQGIRILDLETAQEQQNYHLRQKERESRKQQLQAAIAAKKTEYQAFIKGLSTKYDIPVDKMTIDPDSRAIHELKGVGSPAKA